MTTDSLLFLRQLITNPAQVSAISPSSRHLARAMSEGLGPQSGPVVEFGPGTGRLTEAALATGLPPERLTLIELDPAFVGLLKRRFPGVRVLQGGAEQAAKLVPGGVERVISGLPLLSMPAGLRRAIVAAAFDVLAPGGSLVQFSYGETPALSPEDLATLGLGVSKGRKIWLNLPPARIYHYHRA